MGKELQKYIDKEKLPYMHKIAGMDKTEAKKYIDSLNDEEKEKFKNESKIVGDAIREAMQPVIKAFNRIGEIIRDFTNSKEFKDLIKENNKLKNFDNLTR